MELYLLHLELDGGFEIVSLGRQVIVVGHQGGELPSLGSQEQSTINRAQLFLVFYIFLIGSALSLIIIVFI
jgi:hypothetical protein